MRAFLLVGLGGWVGAFARYTMDRWVIHWIGSQFPYGTLLINLIGCLILGFLGTLARDRLVAIPAEVWLLASYGFLGAFTTFSTFSFETLRMLEDARFLAALANLLGSVLGGLLACYLGAVIARSLAG
ncbi:MAG TPA: fluoride efflux transporter CrcB [Stenomitos sp.]